MAAAEAVNDEYDAPNFGVDKSKSNTEIVQEYDNTPVIIETSEEEKPAEPVKTVTKSSEEYVNISNPEDDEIYEAPRKPQTPQEQLQFAIDNIEKRSKYLDEPNVISDKAIDDIISSISFFGDDET